MTYLCDACGHSPRHDERIERDGWTVQLSDGAWYRGEPVALPPSTLTLMHGLMVSPRTCSKDALINALHSDADINLVRVHICNSRTAMKDAGSPEYIKTVWGKGYRWGLVTDLDTASFTDLRD